LSWEMNGDAWEMNGDAYSSQSGEMNGGEMNGGPATGTRNPRPVFPNLLTFLLQRNLMMQLSRISVRDWPMNGAISPQLSSHRHRCDGSQRRH
jgi:hypothetical protein